METVQPSTVIEEQVRYCPMWVIVLWNDRNLIEHVVDTLMRVLHHPRNDAEKIMWCAHTRGCSVAWHDVQEHCEWFAQALARNGLTVSIQEDV